MLLRTGNLSCSQSLFQFLQCTWTHTFLLKINRFQLVRALIFFFFFGTGYWLLSDLSSYKVTQYSAPPEQTQQMLPAEEQQWVLSRLLPIWIGCYWGDSGAASQNAGNVSHLYPDCIWTIGFIWWVMCPVLSSCADFLPASPVGSVSRKAMLGTVPSVSGVRQQGDQGATSLFVQLCCKAQDFVWMVSAVGVLGSGHSCDMNLTWERVPSLKGVEESRAKQPLLIELVSSTTGG